MCTPGKTEREKERERREKRTEFGFGSQFDCWIKHHNSAEAGEQLLLNLQFDAVFYQRVTSHSL